MANLAARAAPSVSTNIRHDTPQGVLRLSFSDGPEFMSATLDGPTGQWFHYDYTEDEVKHLSPILNAAPGIMMILAKDPPKQIQFVHDGRWARVEFVTAFGTQIFECMLTLQLDDGKSKALALERKLCLLEARLTKLEANARLPNTSLSDSELGNLALNMQFNRVTQLLDAGVPAIRFSIDKTHVVFTLITTSGEIGPDNLVMAGLLLKRIHAYHRLCMFRKPLLEFLLLAIRTSRAPRKDRLISFLDEHFPGKKRSRDE